MTSEQAAFICSHVYEGKRPVLLVIKEGGDWQFLCGGEHPDEEVPHVVGLLHLLEKDPTLSEVLDIPDGCEAERSDRYSPWIKTKLTPEK